MTPHGNAFAPRLADIGASPRFAFKTLLVQLARALQSIRVMRHLDGHLAIDDEPSRLMASVDVALPLLVILLLGVLAVLLGADPSQQAPNLQRGSTSSSAAPLQPLHDFEVGA